MVGGVTVSFTTVHLIRLFPTILILRKHIKYYYELKEIGDKEGNERWRRVGSVSGKPRAGRPCTH